MRQDWRMTTDPLTPNQQAVLAQLMDKGGARPEFDENIAQQLKRALEESLSDLDEKIIGTGIVISKSALFQVLACEGHFEADADNFEWSRATATGTVAHKAIELASAIRDDYSPTQLVDIAIERIQEIGTRGTPAQYLAQIGAAELAELRVAAIDRVSKFQDSFPPLDHSWRPRVETSLQAEVLNGALVLKGKPDLALGMAKGTTARVLLIDFKTGKPGPYHFDDLRFYALLETLRVGTPPFRTASFYLDSGTWLHEDVTEDNLFTAVRRTSDGIRRIIELRSGSRSPDLTPGSVCFFCSARHTCPKASTGSANDEDFS